MGESGDLDPDVGAHDRDKCGGVVPPAATAVGEDYGEVGEVACDVLDQGRVGVAVRRTGKTLVPQWNTTGKPSLSQ